MYWLRYHLVIQTSSLADNEPKSPSLNCGLSMWTHIGTRYQSCIRALSISINSHSSGSSTRNTVITGHSSQHQTIRSWWSMSWKCWGHFDIEPCACQRAKQSRYITVSQCRMTCSITWVAWCKLCLRKWPDGTKRCSWLWCHLNWTCRNITLMWLQRLVWYIFLHIFSILSGSCNCWERGTTDWISILRTRHPTLPNTIRPSWSL